jgi:hypothetical protein
MSDYESIRHLDFEFSGESLGDSDGIRYESFDASRETLIEVFYGHLQHLTEHRGSWDPDDFLEYHRRRNILEYYMNQHLEVVGLYPGEIIQVNVPIMIYPEICSAEFNGGEAVIAKFEGMAVYPHFEPDEHGGLSKVMDFALNLSISDPIVVSPRGREYLGSNAGVNPVISLHHKDMSLYRVHM